VPPTGSWSWWSRLWLWPALREVPERPGEWRAQKQEQKQEQKQWVPEAWRPQAWPVQAQPQAGVVNRRQALCAPGRPCPHLPHPLPHQHQRLHRCQPVGWEQHRQQGRAPPGQGLPRGWAEALPGRAGQPPRGWWAWPVLVPPHLQGRLADPSPRPAQASPTAWTGALAVVSRPDRCPCLSPRRPLWWSRSGGPAVPPTGSWSWWSRLWLWPAPQGVPERPGEWKAQKQKQEQWVPEA
jgi:hypothetical protein